MCPVGSQGHHSLTVGSVRGTLPAGHRARLGGFCGLRVAGLKRRRTLAEGARICVVELLWLLGGTPWLFLRELRRRREGKGAGTR